MIKPHYIKNTLTIWLRSFITTLLLEFHNRDKHLKIGYMANISDCKFGQYNTVYDFVALKKTEIGDFTYVSSGSNIINTKIGKFCSIGPDVKCGLGRHPSRDFVSTHPVFYSTLMQSSFTFADRNYFDEFGKVEIGNDVWIGANVVILDGVVIGDGAIIGAGSVVTQSVPPYAIMSGIPAKVVRLRFDESEIKHLLEFRWWNKDLSWLTDNWLIFHDVKVFLHKISSGLFEK
jgi:acetyltransferase-like isoleucine patch superfamily enzyme